MKNYLIPLLAGTLAFGSCTTYSEWNRGTTGAYVGSMFGSIIGDIIGGHYGSDVGALIGGAAGAAIGVATAHDHNRDRDDSYTNRHHKQKHETHYSYNAPESPSRYLEIKNVVFADANSNRILEGGETAYVTFEIANHSDRPIYNVAPVITVDNRRIAISPTATIAKIDAGRGMRYKATVCALNDVRSGMATFSIGFAERGNKLDPAKTFRINVQR